MKSVAVFAHAVILLNLFFANFVALCTTGFDAIFLFFVELVASVYWTL